MKIDLKQVEEAAKLLYIRAVKLLPPDIKQGFAGLDATETDATAKRILGTMIVNIKVAEETDNLLCQDTGIPIYNVVIGRGVEVDGAGLKAAIREGCARATREHPLRSSVVHPVTRKNEQTSCGRGVPVIHFDFSDEADRLSIEMVPKGSGSENNSWLRMAIPAEGVDAINTFVVDCVLAAGGKTCPPTIVGVGVGGTADLCMHLAKVAATRPLGSRCSDREGAKLERALSQAVNQLGVGPQGLGGDSTAFAVHVETAATHITMNPRASNTDTEMRVLLAVLFTSMLGLAQAAEVAGVKFAEQIDGPGNAKLVLNGAGLRKRFFLDIYAMGLYLPERLRKAEEILTLAGPKRITIHMLRDVSAESFTEALIDGLRKNHSDAEMVRFGPRIAQLTAIMADIKEAKEGMAIDMDWAQGDGLRLRVDGQLTGQPIVGEDFYRALLRIWLGLNPVQDDLKAALLGAES